MTIVSYEPTTKYQKPILVLGDRSIPAREDELAEAVDAVLGRERTVVIGVPLSEKGDLENFLETHTDAVVVADRFLKNNGYYPCATNVADQAQIHSVPVIVLDPTPYRRTDNIAVDTVDFRKPQGNVSVNGIGKDIQTRYRGVAYKSLTNEARLAMGFSVVIEVNGTIPRDFLYEALREAGKSSPR